MNSVAVIGGGASGIVSAISAKRCGARVFVCEKNSRLGKKIIASGNGRCNLLNDSLDSSHYNKESRDLVKEVFKTFGKNEILEFFDTLGLKVYSDEGRIFPVTNQSSSVLKVLETEVKRLSIDLLFEHEAVSVDRIKSGFQVSFKNGAKVEADKVILACGGMSYPALGSNGSAYSIAKRLGHTIVSPVPAAVPLVSKDRFCHILQGQKIHVRAKSLIDNKIIQDATGDLLFTKYGLSGTCILDLSREISVALNRDHGRNVTLSVDMVPFMEKEELAVEISRRMEKKYSDDELLTGILPNKLSFISKDVSAGKGAQNLADLLKNKIFSITGTRGWNECEFTDGGVDTSEVCLKTLESKKAPGIFMSGEELNVVGERGGYNLAWAWASGFVAGKGASHA